MLLSNKKADRTILAMNIVHSSLLFHCGTGYFVEQNGASSTKQLAKQVPTTVTTIVPVIINAKQITHICRGPVSD